ncbi:MAG: hypothetical protein R2873_32345 [Caldilineaceae bacterium]
MTAFFVILSLFVRKEQWNMANNSRNDDVQRSLGGWRFSDILRDFAVTWQLMRDPRVSFLLKSALILFAFFYWVSPLDLMIGPLDDTAIMILAVRTFVQMAPREAVENALIRLGRLRPRKPSDQPDRDVWNIWDDDGDNNTISGQWRVVDDKE